MRKELGVTVYKLGKKGFEAIKKATKSKKKYKKMTKDQLGKTIIAGSVPASVPLSFLAQKTGQIEREARKSVSQQEKERTGSGSGLSAKQKKAWVKANTPKDKKKALNGSRI